MLLPDDALYKAYILLYNDNVELRLHEADADIFSASLMIIHGASKATTPEAQMLREDRNILSKQLETERTKLAQLTQAHANVEADLVQDNKELRNTSHLLDTTQSSWNWSSK
jgi:hypothetical protein